MDYKEIVNSLTDEKIKSLLDRLEIPYQEKPTYLICRSACHYSDLEEASWKLYYYKDTHIFYCYSSCGPMSIFKFLKKYYEERQIEYNWYDDVYQVVLDCSNYKQHNSSFISPYESKKNKYKRKGRAEELPVYSPNVLSTFSKKYPIEWIAEGITKSSMDEYNILYSISRNKIIIPQYNIDGQLIGIRGRALNESEIDEFGKYMPIEVEGKWYKFPLSLNLYGLNISKEAIKRKRKVIIFEAEKSCLLYNGYFEDNISCATCGSSLNINQIRLLIKNFELDEIIIAYDKEYINYNDEKGRKYFQKLEKLCQKYSNYCNFSFIYDKENLLKEKDSPIDRGKKIFLELYNNRIKVRSLTN